MNTLSVILHYEATRQRVRYDTAAVCEEDDTKLDELDTMVRNNYVESNQELDVLRCETCEVISYTSENASTKKYRNK